MSLMTPESIAQAGTSPTQPWTLRRLLKHVRSGQRFAALTCYDATTARWLETAGIPMLLVGDTAAEVILGLPGTIHMPLSISLALTAAVKRGAPNTLVMGDMPFLSYQADDAEGVRNAGRFLTEGTADLVKLEVDRSFAPLVSQMVRAGIPVVAHVGSKPQHAKQHGGYYAAGKSAADAMALLDDTRAMLDCGVTMLLVEAAPIEVTERIVAMAQARNPSVPVIGCGAGPSCHGQIVVLQDLLGLTQWQPAFAVPAAHLGTNIQSAARQWMERVRIGELGEHPYVMPESERVVFEATQIRTAR
ncbi:MAG: 3-methyl-2-oxobutanoate hydroxymethyltransferase [Planctomycetota bacterium]|nr:3-methyl-2-oxobutanoate hydroxymethyltransferase [Planctomycetota bacterium]MDA1105896.1 3-methyl-2-oxobutanoate hydroxymethyltransferase [Planctomycetota bacterium]